MAPLAVSVAGRREAYRRLTMLVQNVPDAETLADLMRAAGQNEKLVAVLKAEQEKLEALKEEVGLPVHLHTHDTSGIASATVLAAVEAGRDTR